MIELRTLGACALVAPDSPNAGDMYTRPKPLGLLVYLSLARPRGFQRQDSLLALFWPEADSLRAQQSMRQALHTLRRCLGHDAVVRRGRAELGLDAELVASDVAMFEDAAEAGELERALAIYQGEFMPGFHIPDAPEFERWVSAERLRLVTRAVDCARALIRQADAASDTPAALKWAHRWMALAPFDEAAVRCVMQRHAAIGEDGSAVRTYERLARDLAAEGDVPEAETARLAEAARVRLPRVRPDERRGDAGVKEEPGTREPTTPNAVELRLQPADGADVRPQGDDVADDSRLATVTQGMLVHDAPVAATVRRWPRRAAMVVSGLAALAVATAVVVGPVRLAAALQLTRGGPPPSTRIAVMPFTVRGNQQLGYLREGMVDLLSQKLDNADALSTIDAGTVLAFERSHATITGNLDDARTAARDMAAGQFVLGSIIEVGGHIAVTASLYDVRGHLITSTEGSTIDEAHLLPVIDQIARDLLASEFTGAGARMEHVAATTTASLPALRAFLEGERAARAGQPTLAVDAYRRATADDSTFALAHYRLSTTALWSASPELVQQSTEAAVRFSNRLPMHERLALEARGLIGRGAIEDADRLYHEIVAKYPDDVDAWNQLGESLFHTGPWRGRPMDESRAAFEQVLTRQPRSSNALLHLARLATFDRRDATATALADSALALKPERAAWLELSGLRAVAAHDAGALRALLDTIRKSAGGTGVDDDVRLVAWRVATYSDNPSNGAAIISALIDARSSTRLQLMGRAALAHMDAAGGQWQAAMRELDAVETLDPHFAAETRANLALAWPASLTVAERQRAIRALREDSGHAPAGSAVERDSMGRTCRSYLAATLALANGDTTFVRLQQRVLQSIAREPYAEADLANHLAHELAARVLWRRGQAAEALREVEAGWPKGTERAQLPFFQGDVYTQAHERFLRAELLMALGRDAEAQRWLQTVLDDQGEGLVLSSRVHRALGQLAEKAGNGRVAIAQYERAIALWSGGDTAALSELRTTETRLKDMLARSAHGAQVVATPALELR